MEETRLLLDITFLTAIAGICSILLVKLKFPSIIGYLVAGIVLGPTMLPDLWVDNITVFILSNMGIVLLMFYIGMELNLKELRRIGSYTIAVVTINMTAMVMFGFLVGTMLLGLDTVTSIFLGAIISGTSTAVVVGVLQSQGRLGTKESKLAIGITVLEDIGQVIILTLAAPLLVGESPTLGSTLSMVLVILVFIALSIVLGITIIPRLLNWIARNYSGETLLLVAMALCFAMALASSTIGLSIAIGAFLMGVIVSQSAYVSVLKSKIEPMKELFMAVFFISIGMQIDPTLVLSGLPLALIIASTFTLAKISSVTLASYINGMGMRSSFRVGVSLVAMGEFAFIIAKTALDAGLIDQGFYSSVFGAALITMVLLPVLSRHSDRLYDRLVRCVPQKAMYSLLRFNKFKDEAGKRFEASAEIRKKAKSELLLLSLDLVVIISVMLLVNLLSTMSEELKDAAQGFHILPILLLFLVGLIIITPAVFNTMMSVRRMAAMMTRGAPGEAKGSPTATYRLVRNLGDMALAMVLILLFAPFVTEFGVGMYPALIFLLMTWMVILYLVWNRYKRVYERVRSTINLNIVNPEDEDEIKDAR
ncbi:MAG: cation:proton antiporter [Methanomassiliicoccus sp.]|nr:cation:proton antiporter [Methanomassiliicoccus sp.]